MSVPLKHVARIAFSGVNKIAIPGETVVQLCNYNDVYKRHHITPDIEFMAGTATADEVRRFALREGDVLLTKDSETPDDIGVAAYVAADMPKVICGYHLALIRPDMTRIHPRFLYWFMASETTRQFFAARAQGVTRFGLRLETVGNLQVHVPSQSEQHAIAEYLDREAARVSELVSVKRRLQALWSERLDALVYSATLGLFQPGGRKSSGLEWVSTIPQEWTIAPVGLRYEVQLGRMLNGERSFGPHMAPYLRNVNVQWRRVKIDDLAEMDFPPEVRPRYRLKAGDLLVCEGGEVGRAAIWRDEVEECYYQKAVHRLRPRSDDEPRYLMYVLRAMSKLGVFAAEGSQTTIPHLTAEKLAAHRVPFPPRQVQVKIADELDAAFARSEELALLIGRQVSALIEYRQAVITDVVTGKLRVAA
ncbi:MAG: restriction endonuclease subunit S [Chloroflexota bacterium]|nr:restriction endonuclease subunit S [Chloroflexota bacterium]